MLAVRGLRTEESVAFRAFFSLVQREAAKQGASFFLDFGEEKNLPFQGMELDDLFGWLVPLAEVDEFEEAFNQGQDLSCWDDNTTWCIPTVSDQVLNISFESYDWMV